MELLYKKMRCQLRHLIFNNNLKRDRMFRKISKIKRISLSGNILYKNLQKNKKIMGNYGIL